MSDNSKQKWLIWSVVILGVLNLSTWATIAYYHFSSTEQQKASIQTPREAVSLSGWYFRQQLNWNQDQMDQFRKIHPSFRREVQYIINHLSACRIAMLNEMFSERYDTARLNTLSDSIGYWHSRLKKLTYRYFFDLKAICTPEQQKQLEQIFREIYTSDIPPMAGRRYRHGAHPIMNRQEE